MHTVNFTSRSATVRKADKICRLVNNTYPAYSPSKIMCKIETSYPSKRDLEFDLYLAQSPLRSDAQRIAIEQQVRSLVDAGLLPEEMFESAVKYFK